MNASPKLPASVKLLGFDGVEPGKRSYVTGESSARPPQATISLPVLEVAAVKTRNEPKENRASGVDPVVPGTKSSAQETVRVDGFH